MKRYFFAGVVLLLPAAVTCWIILVIVNFLTKPFMGIVVSFFKSCPSFSLHEHAVRTLSQILILIALFLFTLFLGFVARRFFFNQLLRFGDRLLHRIPLVNKIYKTSKEIVNSFFNSKKGSFKQVVLLPFPYKGSYCLGLISGDAPEISSKCVNAPDLTTVFIPTTPNPTTGYVVMCKKADLVLLDMKSEDAIKYIVSCGVIQPEASK